MYFKSRGIGVNCCWNYEQSKLLHFIKYRLDQLNNKHTETAVNSAIQFFESHYEKKIGPPITTWRPCKTFAKLNGNHLLMANIFKLHKCQTFDFWKMHSVCKIWFTSNKFSLWKSLVYDKWVLIFAFFIFTNFKWLLSKIVWKNHSFL